MLPYRVGTAHVPRVRTAFHRLSLRTFDRLDCAGNAKISLRRCRYSLYNWGEPERAPPRDLQRLRSLSHNDNGWYIVRPAQCACAKFTWRVQRSVEAKRVAHARGIVALLNRLNIGRCVQCDEELRIEHGTL